MITHSTEILKKLPINQLHTIKNTIRMILKELYTKKRKTRSQHFIPLIIPAWDKFSYRYKEYRVFNQKSIAFVNAYNPDLESEIFLLKSLLTGKALTFAETHDLFKFMKKRDQKGF
jgi:hypothetical protein